MSEGSHAYVYDNGFAAYSEGRVNPYRYFTEMWKRWQQGYNEAERRAKENV